MADVWKTDGVQRLVDRQMRVPEKIPPESQVLLDRERGLHGVGMAKIMAGRGDGRPFLVAAFQIGHAGSGGQQAGD